MIIKTKCNEYPCASAELHSDGLHMFREDGSLIAILENPNIVEVTGGEIVIVAERTPTQLDVIEAQVAYTAMMTDTLLEV